MASKKKALEADISTEVAADDTVEQPAAMTPAPMETVADPVTRPSRPAKAPAAPAAPKEDWLDKYHGAVMKVPIELGSPMLSSLFNRTFYFTSRNIFYFALFLLVSTVEYWLPFNISLLERTKE